MPIGRLLKMFHSIYLVVIQVCLSSVIVVIVGRSVPAWCCPSARGGVSSWLELIESLYLESSQCYSYSVNLFPRKHGVEFLIISLLHFSALNLKTCHPHHHLLVVFFADVGVSECLHHDLPLLSAQLELFVLHLVEKWEELCRFCFSQVRLTCHELVHVFRVRCRVEFSSWVLNPSKALVLCVHTEAYQQGCDE